MIQMSIAEMAQIMGGRAHGDVELSNQAQFHFDSREVRAGDIFLALKGERADGHDYVADAISSGAALSIVSQAVSSPHILVGDVLVAIAKLASHVRGELKDLKVIGITGSQGKTTTKDLLFSILSNEGETIASLASFNNELGVPLTLLRCTDKSKYCILEMGARKSGDIAALTSLANPDVGAVLKVGNAHLGQFGSQEMIAKTKGELIAGLKSGAVAVLGTYDSFTPEMASAKGVMRVTFGDSAKCDIRAADIEARGGFAHFDLVIGSDRHAVELQILGLHQISNALAAAAIASSLGVSVNRIASTLSNHAPLSKWRMELDEANGLTLINDSYNANPESMEAALKVLSLLAQERGGRSWAFLGLMHELGEASDQMHEEIGVIAQNLGIDYLVAINSKSYLKQINPSIVTARHFDNWKESLSLFSEFNPGDVILVKASRAEGLEELASAIKTSVMIEAEGESI
ncbi:MAG: UDP-N-acetylmuramyl pentapeptide synthase [Actinobacteria bacterium BACL2 MAG-121001-bin67]|jgi:UDP-N-acetylmuramoyl-tripeptide--D-alanyl-D-alanine ligase|uniref:UDP-N-acetylmuramoyl-tripeptide--D-alanyl-D-alanine ligase n=3 Tax=ac1 cluster TaxID=1655545 RepID=A0A0R2P4Q5_9ACTN|nr:MAG: UDP-N-acetylmuramyl pentapeptide synthase [Actinobacteria bacterium BACL2 MAG-121001-bin67]KRO45242.1 MAG: UDP-N-acetylmuramyl pentapeptide synthase [Actinobacteria bacterium BACL2 MAG-120813-bin23]KRO74350.1 MAG: UDP-N-acetylmuramyl pentapeptide synthase [Actinobacteria bacterium BACL2 MAG-120920-bin34]